MNIDLNDYFAGLAMQGLLVNRKNDPSPDDIAQYAYLTAESMMKERLKGITSLPSPREQIKDEMPSNPLIEMILK
tara:strand:+ start:26 stop:250 length:225 start_codon:yes stop_codon:yes gene_type:complete